MRGGGGGRGRGGGGAGWLLLSEDCGNVEPRGSEGEITQPFPQRWHIDRAQHPSMEEGGSVCVCVGGGGGVGGRQFSVNGDNTQQVRILTCRPQRSDRHPAAVNTTCASGGRPAGPSGSNVK